MKTINKSAIKKNTRLYTFVKWTLFLLIIILIIPRLNHSKFPGTSTDEFGYLYHAARFVGWNWDNLVEYYPFYGAGISILWLPSFLLFSNNPEFLYQSIVFINAILLAISFWISLKCADNLFPDWNEWIKLFSCFCIVFYPSNYFYAREALPETLLYLLFWTMILALIKFIDSYKIKWLLVVSVTSGYMILVHLRTAGLLIALTIFLIYFFLFNKISLSKFVPYLLIITSSGIALILIQQNYYQNLGGANAANVQNTQISITNMLETIITNLISSGIGCSGHIFYYLLAGGLVFFFAMLFLAKKSIHYLRSSIKNKKSCITNESIFLFLIFAFIINFVAFYVTPHEYIARLDVALYGRYMENFMGPFLLCGLYCLTKKHNYYDLIAPFMIIVIGSTAFLIRIFENANEAIFSADSAPAAGGFFAFDMSNLSVSFSVLKMVCVILFFASLISMVYRWGPVLTAKKGLPQRFIPIALLGLVFVYWNYLGISSEKSFTEKRTELYEEYDEIKQQILAEDPNEIVFIQDTPNSRNNEKYLQFLIREWEIQVEGSNYLKEEHDDVVFLCEKQEDYRILEDEGYERHEFSRLILYLK